MPDVSLSPSGSERARACARAARTARGTRTTRAARAVVRSRARSRAEGSEGARADSSASAQRPKSSSVFPRTRSVSAAPAAWTGPARPAAGSSGRRATRGARRRRRRARAPASCGTRIPSSCDAPPRAPRAASGAQRGGVARAGGAEPSRRRSSTLIARRHPVRAPPPPRAAARQAREQPRSCGAEGAGLAQTTRARDPARRRARPESARARRLACRRGARLGRRSTVLGLSSTNSRRLDHRPGRARTAVTENHRVPARVASCANAPRIPFYSPVWWFRSERQRTLILMPRLGASVTFYRQYAATPTMVFLKEDTRARQTVPGSSRDSFILLDAPPELGVTHLHLKYMNAS